MTSGGNSAIVERRSNAPTRVTLGSRRILNSGPAPSFATSSSARRASASTTMDRNFNIQNCFPALPTRCWRKNTGPGHSILIANATITSSGSISSNMSNATDRSIIALKTHRPPVNVGWLTCSRVSP